MKEDNDGVSATDGVSAIGNASVTAGVSVVTQEANNDGVSAVVNGSTAGSKKDKGKKAAQASSNATVQKTVKKKKLTKIGEKTRQQNGVSSAATSPAAIPQSSQIPTQSSQIGAPGIDAGQAGLVQQLDTLFSNVIKSVTQGDSAANGSNRD
ncbi:STE STE7 kinase [Sesbania bispinosa]|nr:STE STE7 kinase [Sesbania bispinosa]